jgi:alpha-glucosidase
MFTGFHRHRVSPWRKGSRPAGRGFFPLVFSFLLALGLAVIGPTAAGRLMAAPVTSKFGPYYLTQQRFGNGLWRFRISAEEPNPNNPWVSTPMLASATQWAGPHEGPESRLYFTGLDGPTPQITISETLGDGTTSEVFRISPFAPENQLAGLTFHGDRYTHVVGLGADFRFSFFDINRLGRVVMPGGPFGSILETSFGTRASGIQSPVAFALGQGFQNAAIFINETRPLAWDFSSSPWYVGPTGPLGPHESVDFFVILGKDIPALRRILMSILGRQALPPKSVFSPWIIAKDKEPYENYKDFLANFAQHASGFPTLTLMLSPQPDPPPLAEAAEQKLNILLTESPYIPMDSTHFSEMARRGFLVRGGGPQANPLLLTYQGKKSGLIDYSHSPAATYWNNETRTNLIFMGAKLFNLVGGEPEIYSPSAWYQGTPGEPAHSQYAWGPRFALKWMESFNASREIFRFGGFGSRLFSVSRAGMAGMSRFGTGILTFEPNPVFVENAAQARANLILSGVDYYSTDITQFFANAPAGRHDPVYESWLANIVLLNLPLVIPNEFLGNAWARVNLEIKASFEPYYYSLAHHSSQTGEPLISPLLYYFQDDPLARDNSAETMIGPHLMVAAKVTPNMEVLQFYLPKGRWYDFHNREMVERGDGELVSLPAKKQGLHVAPLVIREGAIIPMIQDPAGPRRRKALLVFPGPEASTFSWYEDNGTDLAYLENHFSSTAFELSPLAEDAPIELTIKAKSGSFAGEEVNHRFWIEFVGLRNVGTATLDGEEYKRPNGEEQLHALDAGWFSLGNGRLVFKTPALNPAVDHKIVLK